MTAALARFSARYPRLILLVWGVLIIGGGLFADDAGLGFNFGAIDLLDRSTTAELTLSEGAESSQADQLIEDRLTGPQPIAEIVIVQSETVTVDDPAFRARVESLTAQLAALGPEVITPFGNYYQTGDEGLVSADRRTMLAPFLMNSDYDEAAEAVGDVFEIVREANGEDGFRVLIVGEASIGHELVELSEADIRSGEQVGLPIAFIVLIILFGTVVAALAPMILAVGSIAVTLGIIAFVGQAMDLSTFITFIVIMLGLAVGIDYSLLIITRFRDEEAKGLDRQAAIERAAATAGRTALVSGLTVIIALCGLLFVPFSFFQSFGLGAILIVLVSVAATLTFLPANLALHGDRLKWLPVPYFGSRSISTESTGGSAFWNRVTGLVTRFPVISLVAVAGPLLVVSYFYFDIKVGLNGVDAFPEHAETREAFLVMEEHFSFGLVYPTNIVIDGDQTDPNVSQAVADLQGRLFARDGLTLLPFARPNEANDLSVVTLFIDGGAQNDNAVDLIDAIRDEDIPAAFEGVEADVYVGGQSAVAADVLSTVSAYTPFVLAFILGFSFILLMLAFRSLVIPVKAVIMNLISVGATYGLLVLVFQKGFLRDFFGFSEAVVIDAWIPLMLFAILFGLSMDYHIFMLSRIRERFDETGDNEEAVSYGLRSTAGIITGAALIMVVVFSAFAAGDTIINQQVGFGLAVAVALDATLVRSILVPASMELLGRRNWYLPSWLSWLPDLRIEAEEEEHVAAESGD